MLAGHDIGHLQGRQITRVTMLRALAGYLAAPERGEWVAPVGTVAEWIQQRRKP